MKADIVMEGGGIKGIGLLGALALIQEEGYEFSRVAGASAGAITASLTAAGYSPTRMYDIMMKTSFTDFMDGSKFKTKRAWDIMSHLGAHKGDAFEAWITEMLDSKGIRTFGDISIPGVGDPKHRWNLKVIISDITQKRILIFPDDAELFGLDPNEVSVPLAIRASMSIPFFFRPVKISTNWCVDGGMLSNFPIWLFDRKYPRHPTFGLLLKEEAKNGRDLFESTNFFNRVFKFSGKLINTMMEAHDRKNMSPEDFRQRVISIPVGDTGTTDFDISMRKKALLYHNGYDAAERFLRNWSWDSYKEWACRTRE